MAGPVIFLCDGNKDSPEKNILERIAGKKSPSALRSSIQKALTKIEPKK